MRLADNDKERITRRGFVKGAALAAGAAAAGMVGGCAAAAPADVPAKWNEETEVVVIGLGGAGAAAAITATEAGAQALVLEKGQVPGGSTALSGQAIYAAGTSVQRAAGISDSAEAMLEYYMAACDGDPEIIKMLCYDSGPNLEWLIELGMQVPAQVGSPGLGVSGVEALYADVTPVVPRAHVATPEASVWKTLMKTVDDRGIKYYLETGASKLVWDGKEVVGVEASKEGEPYYIRAKKGVVIAAGGFSRNKQMLYDWLSSAELATWTCPNDDGSGIRMAQSVGCGIAFPDSILGTVGWKGTETYCLFLLAAQYVPETPPYIVVNLDGKRFLDEGMHYILANARLLEQPKGAAYVITSGEAGRKAIATEDVKTGATIEDLAEALDLDSATLRATVDAWNKACQDGEDVQFGRTELLNPLTTGPFYAGAIVPGFGATAGGIKINAKSEVLNALTGQPIPRLYAAGCGAASYGRFYPSSGTQINECICTGRNAGRNAAALDSWA